MSNPFLSLFSIDEYDVLDKMTAQLSELGVESLLIFPGLQNIQILGSINDCKINVSGNSLHDVSQKYCDAYEKLKIEPASAA